jgi:DNA-binding response OmpR family regulator
MSQPKGTLLVVDDFDDGRFLLATVLRTAGYGIMEAANGAEALSRMEQRPDLVVLDVHLPDMDGFEVCRRIKADLRTATTPIVQVSAVFSQTEHRVRGLSGGADAYLPKPFEPELLVATVDAVLRASEQARKVEKMEAAREIAGGIAHDLKSVLTVIGGRAELLKRDVSAESRASRDVDVILSAANRAAGLTSKLTACTREVPRMGGSERPSSPPASAQSE